MKIKKAIEVEIDIDKDKNLCGQDCCFLIDTSLDWDYSCVLYNEELTIFDETDPGRCLSCFDAFGKEEPC